MVGGGSSKGKRPMETPLNRVVKLCFKSQDGCEVYYKISGNTDIQELLKVYCEENNLGYEHVTFLHDGARLAARGTVHELGIMDGDQIDVMISQSGGGPSKCVA